MNLSYSAFAFAASPLPASGCARHHNRPWVVLTLIDDDDECLMWSGELADATDTEDYAPLQRSLAARMAASMTRVLDERS
jgi:hypothetical protein